MYEALEDAGFVAGAINITCYRGRHRYVPTVPGFRRPVHGPSRFFFYNLYESDRTGAPFAGRGRKVGAVDAYAAGVGRWLVTRDGFDFLVYYLSDYDFASHEHGPAGAMDVALERVDASIGALLDAAGGPDEFLERYAVILLSDHGQTEVKRVARLEPRFADLKGQVVVTASNRAGQVYLLPGARVDAAELARRLDGEPAVEVTLRREGDDAVARRDGEDFPADELEHPDAAERVRAALANPNAGELLVSVAEGWELVDLGGGHHLGGGSHGSLVAGDSFVPLLTIGVDGSPRANHRGRPRRPRPLRSVACGLSRGSRWSSASCAAAVSRTRPCSRRWSACRASSSSRPSSGRGVRRRCASDRRRADDLAAVHGRAHLRVARAADGTERVLDVGTGSGYQAAVLAELAA